MQVSVESVGALERRMEVNVPATRVEKAVDERLQKMSRTLRLKGFRPGKVPVKVVRQQFGPQVRQEVLGDVVQATFAEAIAQQKLAPAGGPRIEPLAMEEGADLKYRATFEVFPEIALKDMGSLAVTRPTVEITQADIDAMVENLRVQRATFSAVERESRDGDRVTVDFEGTVDGVPFEGGKGERVPIVLGGGRMLPDFEAGLKGVRVSEEKTISLTFPSDYPAANLSGKQAKFAVKVHLVEERALPEVDEEFLKAYGISGGGPERLREEIEDNMKRELAEAIRGRIKQQVLDQLLNSNPTQLPRSLVEAQVRELQLDAGRRMGARDASQLPPAENFVKAAETRVAISLLIGEVIKSAKLELDRTRLKTKFEELIHQYPDPAQALQAFKDNRDAQRQVESFVFEEQAVEWLLERAQITDKAATFREVMNFGA